MSVSAELFFIKRAQVTDLCRFLWAAFQIDYICSQKIDEAILAALEDLPMSLSYTFTRILRNLQQSNVADPRFCKKIINLVAAAQRPFTLEELCEAVGVEPGKTLWHASKLVNDMLRLLLDSFGSLIAVDEENMTVHFVHHSVKLHISSRPEMDSDGMGYYTTPHEAHLYLGDITVTYLNWRIFDQQLQKAKSTLLPHVRNYSSAILGGSLSRSNFASKLATGLLTKSGSSRSEFEEQTQLAHPFLPYAQNYRLFHTR